MHPAFPAVLPSAGSPRPAPSARRCSRQREDGTVRWLRGRAHCPRTAA